MKNDIEYFKYSENRHRNQKLLFISIMIAVFAVIIICTFFVIRLFSVTQDESERYLTELTDSVADSVNKRIEANMNVLQAISLTYADGLYGNDMEFLQNMAEMQGFIRISVMNKDGVSLGSDGSYFDFSQTPEILKVLQGYPTVVNGSWAYIGEENGFAYAVPVFEGSLVIGALVACDTMDSVKDYLSQEYFDGNGFYHIIEPDGTLVIKSDKANSMVNENNFFDVLSLNSAMNKGSNVETMKQRIAQGESGTVYYTLNEDGISKICKYVPLSQNGLYLLLIIPDKAANSQFHILVTEAVVVNAAISVIFILVVIFLFKIYNRRNKQLYNIAFTDPITNGYSQTRFTIEAEKKIHFSPAETYSFITLNVSKFKLINDSFGLDKGNMVLRHIHKTLISNIRDDELVCRAGSDHFNLLVKSLEQKELLERIDNIISIINNFNINSEKKYFLNFSVGVYNIDEPSLPIVNIRDRANVARKSSGPLRSNRLYTCVFYSDLERKKQQREKEIENKMNEAMEREEFLVYLQPKIELKTQKTVGAEALVRWLDSEKGLIAPNDFIPFFEKNGFIINLDLYVFEKVCEYIRKWIDSGKEPVCVSVNMSRVHLKDDNFLQSYIDIKNHYNIPAELLEIELTENLLFENLDNVIKIIDKIHNAGFKCSLDDFGSGYSSLNMLKDIHVDTLKLDKAFFTKSPQYDNSRERAIIESVVNMAKKLNMTTVSEGVETVKQLNFLSEIKCDMAQGFVISKPIPVNDFELQTFGRVLSNKKDKSKVLTQESAI